MRNIYITIILLSVALFSCEDVISVDSGFQESTLAVDAWLDNLERPQTIRLTQSQDYFNNSFTEGVPGATVYVEINGNRTEGFIDQGNGDYLWEPAVGETLGSVEDQYTLFIEVDGKSYQGSTKMNRVPVIDSIAQVFEEEQLGLPEGIYGELFVTDLPGSGDTYWVKTWKNGEYLNKPEEILIIYDATFDSGNDLDGIQFIFPLRRGINPFPDSLGDSSNLPPPYIVGDSIYVELNSISNDAHRFLQIAFEQMTNGNNGIFSLPVANTKSNIIDQSTGAAIFGFFNVAAVEVASKVIE